MQASLYDMRCFAIIMLLLFSVCVYGQSEERTITCMVPVVATYPGGTHSLHQFIDKNFIQPDAVPDSSFCKKGKVKFTIDKNGIACQFEILDSLGYNCDEEIIRILKLARWSPAIFNGKKIDDTRILPYTVMFEKWEPINSNTSPQSEPCALPQMLLVKYE